jgi:effector-binding domain-containing protein
MRRARRFANQKDTAMSFFESVQEFVETVRRLASHWRLLAALAVLVAFAAIYAERKLFPAAPPPAATEAKAPSQTAGQPPAGQPPAEETRKTPGDKTEPPAAEAPAPDLASQMVEVAARPVIIAKGQGTWEDAVKTLAEAVAKVNDAAAKAGLTPNGRPLAVFTRTDDKGFHFEAMVPLSKAPEGKPALGEGLEVGSSPAGKALKFQHRGGYDEIEATYEAIAAYLDEKGLDSKDMIIEEFLTDLKAGDENLEVDIYVFVK